MLDNMVVAISGGAGIIGSAFAKEIVKNRGKVLIGDVNEKMANSLISQIGDKNAIFIKCNLTKADQIDYFIKKGLEKFNRIDALVHCSYPKSKHWGTSFEELNPKDLKENLYNQLGSAIILSQKIIKIFQDQGFGNLIHISSIQGIASPKFDHYEGTSMSSPIEYSAIKSGIISITKYLAKYLKGTGIRVNCLSPGGILNDQPNIFLEKYNDTCLTKGMLNPSDLSGALIFLLSNQSDFINGQNIIIDDGWSL